jgi:cysteine desulfurase
LPPRRIIKLMPAPIYLDHNATTPILPEVVEAMRVCWAEPCLNPASQHEFGRRARRKLEDARERIAELIGVGPGDRVVFTSGGTESNNLAIRSFLQRAATSARLSLSNAPPPTAGRGHFIISPLEHPSITVLADELARRGWHAERLPVDCNGVACIDVLATTLRPETRFAAIMLGQNETGALQPVAEIAAICNTNEVPLHTDAAQVVGKLPVNFRALGAATMSVAAHKFHGPVGIGALVVRHGVELSPQLFGGFQQSGTRPGTESVALAVGMCRAFEISHAEQSERIARLSRLRDRFEKEILTGYPGSVVIGANAQRLPNTSNIAFVGLDRQQLFMALDQAGVACSTGSACASGSSEPSPALIAMGLKSAQISSALRFSLGRATTAAEVEEAARRILRCCNDLRRQNKA